MPSSQVWQENSTSKRADSGGIRLVVLDKVCGEANKAVFVGFTDLFQQIIDGFIPNFWPFSVIEEIFNKTFDSLQTQMKPLAYNQGAAMGKDIEDQVNAWIKSQFDIAISELNKVKNQALGEIDTAKRQLAEQQEKIQNLLDRVRALESKPASPFGGIFG